MRILIINYEYPPVGGGGGVVTKALAGNLNKKGIEVCVLTSKFRGLKFYEKSEGVEIYRVPVLARELSSKASMLSMFTFPLFSLLVGIYICTKNRFDIINTHFFAPSGPTGFVLSKIFNTPNVIYAHGADVFDPERLEKTPSGKGILSKLLKLSLNIQSKNASGILTQSNDTKNRIVKINPELDEKVKVVPWAFSRPEYQCINKVPHEKQDLCKLITIGRVVKRKGYDFLLEALSKLPEGFVLSIVGDGPELDNLKDQAKNLGINDRVKFLGYLSDNEKFEYLCNSDCYVLSSLHEGMGVVLVEAMHFGLPIVSTNVGGQNDLIKNMENGIMVPPSNPEELARAILKMQSSPELRERFITVNKEKVQKYYAENIVSEYIEYFKKFV